MSPGYRRTTRSSASAHDGGGSPDSSRRIVSLRQPACGVVHRGLDLKHVGACGGRKVLDLRQVTWVYTLDGSGVLFGIGMGRRVAYGQGSDETSLLGWRSRLRRWQMAPTRCLE